MKLPTPLQSARDRGGKRFQPDQERNLEGLALAACQALPGAKSGLTVLREVVGPIGIPDLVAVVGPEALISARMKLAVPPLLNEVDAAVVGATAVKAPRKVGTLARLLGWPVEPLERRVPGLLRSGALLETGRGAFVRPAGLQPIGRLYAFEIKLDDWRRAIRQGRGFRVWCDSYVIVMEALSEGSRADVVNAVGQDGGGVVLGEQWAVRPKITPHAEWRRLWGSEHVVAALGHS